MAKLSRITHCGALVHKTLQVYLRIQLAEVLPMSTSFAVNGSIFPAGGAAQRDSTMR